METTDTSSQGIQICNKLSSRSRPLVSIIIPTYNRKALLPEAVDSCLHQTWPAIEVLIIDDGSTDGTAQFVASQLNAEWSKKEVHFHVQTNAGASAARNRGLALATGDYVQFLDSDDILFEQKIALQVSRLEKFNDNEAEGCTCYGRAGMCVDPKQSVRIGVCCNSPQDYLRLLSSRTVHGMQTSAPLWRRSFLTSQPGWRTDINLGDDLEYYIRLLARARHLEFIDQDLFLVREHSGPRLSDAAKNRARTLSAIRARTAILDTLRCSGNWHPTIQRNFLRAMRTIYANLMDCGSEQDILSLENWLLDCTWKPSCCWFFPVLITLRRLLGHQVILGSHRIARRILQLGHRTGTLLSSV